MTLRSSDLQSDSDLDSICNSCDVFSHLLAGVSQRSSFVHFSPWRENGSSRCRFAWNKNCTKKMEDRICKIGNSPPESLESLGGSHPTSVFEQNTLPVLAFLASTSQWQITELQPSPVDLKKNQWGSVFLRRHLPAGVSQCCPFLHFLPSREKGSSSCWFAWNMFCTKKAHTKTGFEK